MENDYYASRVGGEIEFHERRGRMGKSLGEARANAKLHSASTPNLGRKREAALGVDSQSPEGPPSVMGAKLKRDQRRYTFSVLAMDPASPKTPGLVGEGWQSQKREGHLGCK